MTDPVDTDITILGFRDGIVELRLHRASTVLRIDAADAARLANEIDGSIIRSKRAGTITIDLDEQHRIIVSTHLAKRLAVDLQQAALRALAGTMKRKRKTDNERSFINDSTALGKARTRETALRIAHKMLDEGQDQTATLNALWACARRVGWDAAIRDSMD